MNIFNQSRQTIQTKGIKYFMRAALRYVWREVSSKCYYASVVVISPTIINNVVKDFRNKTANLHSIKDLVNFSYNYKHSVISIVPGQHKKEIIAFLKIVKRHRVRHMLEIGTEKGGTLFLFSRVSMANANIISINLPLNQLDNIARSTRNKLLMEFATKNQKIHLIKGNSHFDRTLKEVKRILDGKKLDLLFIDGDHTYEGVKADFNMYGPLVRKKGIIAFHDISDLKSGQLNEVQRFYNEVKKRHKGCYEIAYPRGLGIGVFKKD